jgi:hypothetical protein
MLISYGFKYFTLECVKVVQVVLKYFVDELVILFAGNKTHKREQAPF